MMRADVPYPNARHSENGAWSCIVVGQRSWKRQGADRRVRMFDVKSMVVIGGYNGIKRKRQHVNRRKPCEEKTSSSPKRIRADKTKLLARRRTTRSPAVTVKTLDALNERLDIMLPEVMFRIAAIEHILVKNQLCSYEELVNARQFIQEQEAS
ncbi:MAG: hypothetical protein R3B74_01610 [Nitrospirales bacterium]|nr:hypothetical protein [Nitrospirales bacterium]